MQVVSAHTTLTVPVERGRSTITLKAGKRYVMHDVEVASGQQAGAFRQVKPLPSRPRRFDPTVICTGRMVVPFIGGMGDAVSMLPVLGSLRQQNPDVQIHVTATSGPAEVFALSDHVQRIVRYPMKLDEWSRYDSYLTMEVVHETAQAPGRALPEVFAGALGIELTDASFALNLPEGVDAAAASSSSVPLAGVVVGEGQSLRSYPQSMLRELIAQLVQQGVCCVLLGDAEADLSIPGSGPMITDMRSRTPTVLGLAVWLRAVDVVVAHDSFVMHLAGALGRPTVALFAPTASAHAAPYADAVALASTQDCSPCHETTDRCPRGFDRCVAWDCSTIRPQAVADAVAQTLHRHGRGVPAVAEDASAAL
ncbi:MAG: glycosyltransferase family 9 protein [Planctomycetes bacterium]|nr:glycosyltransferase family 9 protein [Planctomycetota bacterium]